MENNTTKTEAETVHTFERSGLGKAPFRYVGQIWQDIAYGEVVLNRAEWDATGIRASTKPGGTCDYCGAYILNMFQIESADGKRFKVGSDCVLKTGDAGLKKVVSAVVSKMNSERTAKRNVSKIDALKVQLSDESVRAKLREFPHPYNFKGKTLLNFAEYMILRGGTAGKLKAAKKVAAVVAGTYQELSIADAEEQRCDNIAAERFEERAYGRD